MLYFCLLLLMQFGLLFPACSSLPPERITKIVIEHTESPTFEGQEFGSVGRYEKLTGHLFGEVDPAAPENASIVNLNKAPKNAAGHIEYSTDFYILKPVELARGNHKLFYGVINRGNKVDLVMMNNAPYGEKTNDPTTAEDVGNGFLMRQGYHCLERMAGRGKTGAQCCIDPKPQAMGAELPIPLGKGKPMTGTVRDLFVGQQQTNPPNHQTVTLSYPVAVLAPERVQVTVRAKAEGEAPQPIPPCVAGVKAIRCWSFLDEQTVSLFPQFESGLLYEFVYTGKNPTVLGLGFPLLVMSCHSCATKRPTTVALRTGSVRRSA
jgi:hypothetical protein